MQQHRTPWILAGIITLILAGLGAISFLATPEGFRWLGDGVHNSSDIAVYLSYLRQGADGHVLLSDLYAVEEHARRFDPVWSLLGVIARSGIDLVLLHESARIVFAIILVFALWFAARDTEQPDDAPLALILMTGGVGMGWIYSVWLGMTGKWTPTTYAAPDIVTEFAVWPILLGGAHAILSLALLVTTIRHLWSGIRESKTKRTLLGGLAGIVLLSFHPYFAVLLGGIGIAAWLASTTKRSSFYHLASVGSALVLPLLYYVWLIRDPVFGAHHLSDNILPLAPLGVWMLTLFPFLIALIWMWRRNHLPRRMTWAHAWLIVLVILLIALPVPWKRKLTEGAIIPLVLLTMPAWRAVRSWIGTQEPMWIRRLMTGLLIFAAWLGPLHLVTSHLVWIGNPIHRDVFYRPVELFEASRFLRTTTDKNAILLSDNRWTNVWLPSLTGRRVWIGHDHETPDFSTKRVIYNEFLTTTDEERIRSILQEADITHLLLTTSSSRAHILPAISEEWTPVFEAGTVSIWKRN